MRKAVLTLILALTTLILAACSAGEGAPEEAAVSVEQAAFPAWCPTPAYAHVISSVSWVTSVPPGASCPAAYYPSEPQVWSLSPGPSTPPPRRGDGKCSCRWSTPGLCYNQITNGPIADYECYAGACYYYRSFECGYRAPGKPANDCSWKVTYRMEPVRSTMATGSWSHTEMYLVATEPGCQRTMFVPDFRTVLP